MYSRISHRNRKVAEVFEIACQARIPPADGLLLYLLLLYLEVVLKPSVRQNDSRIQAIIETTTGF